MEVTDEPTPEQRALFQKVRAEVTASVSNSGEQLIATFATYTYRLAHLQGANMHEAMAVVYRAGMQHLMEAIALHAGTNIDPDLAQRAEEIARSMGNR